MSVLVGGLSVVCALLPLNQITGKQTALFVDRHTVWPISVKR